MQDCPCGNGSDYESCCARYHKNLEKAPTAELLMRSRYTAYVLGEIDYIVKTIPMLERKNFDRALAKEWSKSSQWLGLEIISTKNGGANDSRGVVEFRARYIQNGQEQIHHEISTFKKNGDRWQFIDGKVISLESADSENGNISRNAPCPCGSGKKYKKCCAA